MRTRKRIDLNSPRLKLTLSSLFGVLFLTGCGVSTIEIPDIQVEVVSSTTPTLVSGGDALVKIKSDLPGAVNLRVLLNNQDVSSAFKKDPEDGRMVGLITGMALGSNTVVANGVHENGTIVKTKL